MKRILVAVVALVVVVGVAVAVVLGTRSEPAKAPSAGRQVAEGVQVTAPDGSQASVGSSPVASTGRSTPGCPSTARPFVPRRIDVQGVARGISVITPPRDANGVPGTPPLTDTGKREFAFDEGQGIRPGDPKGNVLLNAHTYPDGSALGNDLLTKVARGDRITLRGAGGSTLCYTVRRVDQVPADQPLPEYYDREGRPQIAVVVCSGARLGPGQWESRTIFYASPGV